MIRAASTLPFKKSRLHAGLLDGLVKAGAQAVEVFCFKYHFDYTDRQQVRELRSWVDAGNTVHSLHSPMQSDNDGERRTVNLVAFEKRDRVDAMDEVKRALEVAELVPFQFLVQHLGDSKESFSERKFEYALSAIEHLNAFARPLGVTILLENIPNEMSTPEQLMDILRVGHFDRVGLCFDIGHAHMETNVHQAFEIMKDRIRSTHIHDNKRDSDSHFVPGNGSIDWKQAMELLRSAPQVPALNLELDGENNPDVLGGITKSYEFLEKQ